MSDGRVEIKIIANSADLKKIAKELQAFVSDSNKSKASLDKLGDSANKSSEKLDKTAKSAQKATKATKEVGDGAKNISKVAQEADKTSAELSEMATSAKNADTALDGVDGDGLKKAQTDADGLGKELDETAQSANKASTSIKQIVTSLGLVQVANKALSMIKESLDGAIARYDTLSKFPRMMQAIGFEATQTQRSIRKLSAGIEGLPTRLDAVVGTTQRIAFMTKDLGKATDTTLALNNAFLASGASAGDAERGLEQYLQMMSSGKVDMQSWKTLQETMSYGLNKVAEEFGFTGESATRDFYGALRDGEITFDQFNTKLVNLDKGVGGFAELAKENSKGIATSFANIKTAVVKGVADVIGALDVLSEAMTGKYISDNVDSLKGVVKSAFKTITTVIKGTIPVVKVFVAGFKAIAPAIKVLSPYIKGLVAALIALKVALSIKGFVLQLTSSLAGFLASTIAVTGTTNLMTIAIYGLKTAFAALFGPIGWVVAAIGALVGVGVALFSILGQTSPEVEAMAGKMGEASKATQELTDSIADASHTYVKSQESVEGQYKSYDKMVDKVLELANTENLSSGKKKVLKDNIEELNDAVKGLNLSYDEETKKLNMTKEAIQKRLELAKDEEKYTKARERQTEVTTQLEVAEKQLADNSKKLAEAKEQLANAGFNWFGRNNELIKSIEELEANNTTLQSSVTSLKAEETALASTVEDAAGRIAAAQQSMGTEVITSLEQLSGAQRDAVEGLKAAYGDIESAATNMFEKISTESKLSVDEMIANLQHNQEAISNWATNLDSLAERGVNQGILDKLRNMGPEGAGYVQALATASDEKLQELNTIMENGGTTASEALSKAFGVDESKLPENVKNLITETEKSLSESIEAADWSSKGKQITDKIAEEIKNGETTIKENTQTAVTDGVSNAITESETTFTDAGKTIPTEIGDGITENKDAVKTATEGVADEVPSAISGKSEDVKAAGSELISTAGEGVEAGKPDVQAAAEGVADAVPEEIRGVQPDAEEAGGYVVDGVVSGIDNNASSAEDAASNLASGVDDSFASELGIHSPSRVFTQHGSDTVQGLVNGVKSKHALTISTITALANGVTNAMRAGLNQTVQVAQSSANQVVYSLGSARGGAYRAGADTGWGFYSGLASTAGSIYGLAASIANTAAATIRSALRIKSPSRVMMEIGGYVGQGLEYGMAAKVNDIQNVANRMAEAAVPKIDVGASLGNVGGMYGTSSVVYNNQQYTFNANSNGGNGRTSDSEMRRMFKEFKWYMKQEGARM